MGDIHIGDKSTIGDIKESTLIFKPKYTSNRFAAFLIVIVLVAILAVIVLPFLGVTSQDISSMINPPKPSAKEQVLRQIWGTYTDEQNHVWIFSPNQMFNTDGTIYIDGQPQMSYRLIDNSSIYIGPALSKDIEPVPFSILGRSLEIGPDGGKKLILTKTSDSYSTMP
jgi:hypothetical protein